MSEPMLLRIDEPSTIEIDGEAFKFPVGLFSVAELAAQLSAQSKRIRFFERDGGMAFTICFDHRSTVEAASEPYKIGMLSKNGKQIVLAEKGALEAAVSAERDRCAKIADDHLQLPTGDHGECCGPNIADDIRRDPTAPEKTGAARS